MTRDASDGRDEAVRALHTYNRTRGALPRAVRVAVRSNVRRLASLTRTRTAAPTLNLAGAVVMAGEEAWELVAPALRGDRVALARLRGLAEPGVEEARRARTARVAGGNGARPGGPGQAGPDPNTGPSLPEPACDGTDAQRSYLRTLIAFVRETSGHADALPAEVQLRISKRMTSSLGLCARAGDTHRITIAERLFRPGLEDILFDTVKHELAHLADQNTSPNGRSSHGSRWKEWARRLAARPERLGPPEVSRRVARANGAGRGRGERSGWLGRRRGPRGDDPGSPALPDEVRRWLDSR
jgi:predicted SprT family Zn-dependent metalloprotease